MQSKAAWTKLSQSLRQRFSAILGLKTASGRTAAKRHADEVGEERLVVKDLETVACKLNGTHTRWPHTSCPGFTDSCHCCAWLKLFLNVSLSGGGGRRPKTKLKIFSSSPFTCLPAAGLSATHVCADWLHDKSSAAKWAQLLITYLVAAFSNTQKV